MTEPGVLLIIGSGHSGSTVIDMSLGRRSGMVSLGEYDRIGDYLQSDPTCCCGQRFSVCQFWQALLGEAPEAATRDGDSLALASAVARVLPRPDGSRPDAADLLAIGGWGVVFALAPRLIAFENGGWLAPALLILAAQRIARTPGRRSSLIQPGPPGREIRGTLSLSRVVVSGVDALPRSVPIDLELRAGDSLAILCDSPDDAANLADVLTARRAPHAPATCQAAA